MLGRLNLKTIFRRGALLTASALLATLGAADAAAQSYGSVTLAPGFGLQTLSGVSGGTASQEIDASVYGDTSTGPCRGYVAQNPDHVMTITSAVSVSVAVRTNNGEDTTLLINGPSGTLCNDDSNGLNPGLQHHFAPGTYSVWVGSYSQGSNYPYTITFSQAGAAPSPQPVATQQIGGTPQIGGSPQIGGNSTMISLAPGFLPDPQTRSGTVTGMIDANSLTNQLGGSCRGYIQQQPNFALNLTGSFSYLNVAVTSQSDTTLVIQDASGRYWCDDDTNGLNPAISGSWAPGTMNVWVGTYSQGTTASYTIQFTELR